MNHHLTSPAISRKKSSAFTLIELLVVIAIIAILAALLFSAGQSALNSAKKTTAKNQAVQIATAITAYEAEYGKLPAGTNQVDGNLVNILCTTNDTNNNPRGVLFLEATGFKPGKGGTNANGFCDPWSNVYSVALDTTYVNQLSNMPSQLINDGLWTISTTNLTKHIAVWTLWTNKSNIYLINSWD